MVEFTLKLKKRLSDLTKLNREQAKTLNEQVAELGKSKAEAEASLAEARAARALIEQSQAEAVAEIEAVGTAMLQFERAQQASLAELERVLDASISAWESAPRQSLEAEFERTLAEIMDWNAEQNRRRQQDTKLPPVDSTLKPELDSMFEPIFAGLKRKKPRQHRVHRTRVHFEPVTVAPAPRLERQYQPQLTNYPSMEERQMFSALTSIATVFVITLGVGGMFLSGWLKHPQVLTAPVVSIDSPTTAPIPMVYDPTLQSTVDQVKQFNPTTRQAWQTFCTQTAGGASYSQTEQNLCKVLKFLK
ncbi:MAG: hypothetical protein KME07_06460 [Pegethrix bostrychoides GSE-TBD4-15B]|uniref:Uncharacterized protein n=1 Tax=Pegethrix bostrychoides GSE-TBD4-15B TaxID=2839662 RepID=A0A951P8U2_9CYAN|nr:hypothetical protein [Pegethrix bostrychoides GSE-TBD4-15B]